MTKKVLHLGFHKGLENDLYSIAKELNIDLTFQRFDDGISKGSAVYSVGHEKAVNAWKVYKDYYMKFDIIITSDTAPICRVFLQNNWPEIPGKKLIIWVCNRFDYCDTASRDCLFPDQEYFDLIRGAKQRKNVDIMGYTKFENYYAKHMRSIDIGDKIMKPNGLLSEKVWDYKINKNRQIDGKYARDLFFVPPYHNDKIMMNVSKKLNELGINNFNGRYNGPLELSEFKGVIHIPYAWSNLALFEALQLGIIYFIPSQQFMKELCKKSNFFFSPPFHADLLHLSEWYDKDNEEVFVYFDSWDDLQIKVNTTNYQEKRNIIYEFGQKHKDITLTKWKALLTQ